jgi:alpha-glucosidase (family GH31 glycosyl hydrolase)
MPLAFPNDPRFADCDDQYLFGPDLLIAPMLGPGESRTVLLPDGEWTDFWTANSYAGPTSIQVAMPLDRIGVFIRAGAYVPLKLAPSLVPGDSMSKKRLSAVLTTESAAGAGFRANTCGASYVLVYGGGKKRSLTVNLNRDLSNASSLRDLDAKH